MTVESAVIYVYADNKFVFASLVPAPSEKKVFGLFYVPSSCSFFTSSSSSASEICPALRELLVILYDSGLFLFYSLVCSMQTHSCLIIFHVTGWSWWIGIGTGVESTSPGRLISFFFLFLFHFF